MSLIREYESPNAVVAYYAITPRGSRARFERVVNYDSLPGGARSETAIQGYLKSLHPDVDISIISITPQ